MKSENIFKGVNQQIKVFDSAGDKKIFGRLSHFRRSVYGIRICFEIMKFHFDEDINKIEDFFLSELSAGARAKPTGNIDNYVYFHEELGWGILKKQGKHGFDYQLIKLSTAKRFLGMKMGISIAMYIADVLTGDITKNAALSGIFYGLVKYFDLENMFM